MLEVGDAGQVRQVQVQSQSQSQFAAAKLVASTARHGSGPDQDQIEGGVGERAGGRKMEFCTSIPGSGGWCS